MKTKRHDWQGIARGAVDRKPGKPKGKVEIIVQVDRDFSKIPNTLVEDKAGQLFLASWEPGAMNHPERQKGSDLEPVDVVGALTWIQHVTEFAAGYDGDIADVCRIALRELDRRAPGRKEKQP